MAKIAVHAGDFKGEGSYFLGSLSLKPKANLFLPENVPLSELAQVEMASEESVKKFWRTVGMSVAAGALMGPLGAVAGLFVGGNRKNVTFTAVFKDGRKMLATTDSKTYTKLLAAVF